MPAQQLPGAVESQPDPALRLLGARWQRLKRVVDVSASAFLALVALPLAMLIATAIKIDSPGPVLFSHTRIGRGRRPFRLWKFRSMVDDADAGLEDYLRGDPEHAREWSASHKLRDDPRVTPLGRFLRKTSLDELPQFWNVLRGDLSLVGPRPIVAAEIPKYGDAMALYSRVTPGLTGLWQVSGRNDTGYARRIELDCDYIWNWSPALDMKILLKTLPVIFHGRGAY